MWGHSEKADICKTAKEASPENTLSQNLDLGLVTISYLLIR